jgi:hypothetical protein
MKIRLRPEDPEQELTRGDFKRLVREGRVSPSSLVQDPELTRGEWWAADDLRAFHRYSPTVHPPGPHLAATWTPQEAFYDRSVWLSWEGAKAAEDYEHGTLIEDRYGLPPLETVAGEPGVTGVSRFMILPSFRPERVITLVFRAPDVSLEAVMSATSSVWASLSQSWDAAGRPFEPESFDPRSMVRRTTTRPAAETTAIFMTWERLAALAVEAPSCRTLALDGMGYRHKITIDGGLLDASWGNPVEDKHPRQTELIRAYAQLLTSVGLDDFGIPPARSIRNGP